MKNWSVQSRILFFSFFPSCVFSLILSGYLINSSRQDSYQEIFQRSAFILSQLAQQTHGLLDVKHKDQLTHIAGDIKAVYNLYAVSILDDKKNVLAHQGSRFATLYQEPTNAKASTLFFADTQVSIRRTNQFIYATYPVYKEKGIRANDTDETIAGWITIQSSLDQQKLHFYQHSAVIFTLFMLLLIFSIYLAFRLSQYVFDPIKNIVQGLDQINTGNVNTRLTMNKTAEFDAIAAGINRLASSLHEVKIEQQDALEQSTQDLQQTLDELEVRNRELSIGREEAREANKAKSTFLANVSHEIRTPLNSILGFLGLIETTPLDDKQRDHIDMMKKSSKDLLKIINDILDFSKLDAGKLLIEKTSFNLYDVVEDVIASLSPQANQKHLDLSYTINDDVPLHVISDPLRLKQILTNLISNGIKFTQNGRVSLNLSQLQSTNKGCLLRFEIQDTGIGLSKAQIDTLFKPFAQADASTTRQFGGTGLGLVITSKLISAMQGDIRVDSQPNRGSQFIFTLHFRLDSDKYYPSDVDEEHSALKPKPTSLNNENSAPAEYRPTILAVDDNEANLKLLCAFLQVLDVHIVQARNGVEAIEQVEKHHIDMVFMDIQMPIMNGVDATKAIRQLPNGAHIPIVALTAHALSDERENLLKSGMSDYQTKPVTQEQIRQIIGQWTPYQPPKVPTTASSTPEKTSESAPQYESDKDDSDIVNGKLALERANHRSELAQELFTMLLNTLPEDRAKISALSQEEQWHELLEVSHKLHGASKYCGTPQLTRTLMALETALKQGKTEHALSYAQDVLDAIDAMLAWAKTHRIESLLKGAGD